MGITRLFGERISLIFLIFYPGFAYALTLKIENTQGAIFAGELVPYEITLKAEPNLNALLSWKLITKGRTVSKGQQLVRFDRRKTKTTTLALQTPPLKQGISLESKLIIEVQNTKNIQQKTVLESKVMIYGPDIFLADQQFYKQLNIQLFDPVGKTIKAFNDLKIPYKALSKSQLMNLNEKGLIVVGMGVALDQQRGLISTLFEFAREGKDVLILQPSSGAIALSDLSTGPDIPVPSLLLARDSIVTSFATGYKWVTNDATKTHGMVLQNKRQEIRAEIVEYQQGSWDWLQLGFSQSGGELIVCTLPIIGNTDGKPVMQIIVGRLLSYGKEQL